MSEPQPPTAEPRGPEQVAVFTHRVRDYMGEAPALVNGRAGAAEVVDRMRTDLASSVAVVDEQGRLQGIVTEQDVVRRLAFRRDGQCPIEEIMSAPVTRVSAEEPLYQAIALMWASSLRHLPVVDAMERPIGVVQLHTALAAAASTTLRNIERLSHESSFAGLRRAKLAQLPVARDLLAEQVPATELQRLLSRFNADLYRRTVMLCVEGMRSEGWGEPPLRFDVVVMGSGGRRESYLSPDQDNGFILEDYPDHRHSEVDAWFTELAARMTAELDRIGLELCRGHVMATNPVWRKSLSQWRAQIESWVRRKSARRLRLADIFFDFQCVYGDGSMSRDLRDFVTARARERYFLGELYRLDEDHRVALGLFGRLETRTSGRHKGETDLKLSGTLPLVGCIRLLALREGIRACPTLERIDALHVAGVLDADEQDYLRGAFVHIAELLMRQQVTDATAGRPIGSHVSPGQLSQRERDMLVDGFKAIRALRSRVQLELTGNAF